MSVSSVEQVNHNPLGLRRFDCRQEVTVASHQRDIRDLMFGCEESKVYAEKNIDALLLKYWLAVGIETPILQPPLTHLETRKGIKRREETLLLSKPFPFFKGRCWRLVRKAIVVVSPKDVTTRRSQCRQLRKVNRGKAEISTEHFLDVTSVDENGDAAHALTSNRVSVGERKKDRKPVIGTLSCFMFAWRPEKEHQGRLCWNYIGPASRGQSELFRFPKNSAGQQFQPSRRRVWFRQDEHQFRGAFRQEGSHPALAP